ncbi:hypothetical protein [Clavibacter sp. VKM Ac-2542]|uniref:hypothetical protein n=1 Tax=Clavibacter TaxID=1573 RepID=UPI00188D63BE|nr:hypothetical protein [Clavibacter sp. VKM Ac-2542]MBF4621833.1 hypothetical protein [Clavibacter sp. VKM Ac-2542]
MLASRVIHRAGDVDRTLHGDAAKVLAQAQVLDPARIFRETVSPSSILAGTTARAGRLSTREARHLVPNDPHDAPFTESRR